MQGAPLDPGGASYIYCIGNGYGGKVRLSPALASVARACKAKGIAADEAVENSDDDEEW